MKEKKEEFEANDSLPNTSVDEDTRGYFKRVGDVLEEDGFEDLEARNLFVENVFAQIDQKEVQLCCDQTISIIMEKLLPIFTAIQIRKFITNIERFWKLIIMDKFGSHVIQTLISNTLETIKADVEVKQKIVKKKELPSMEVVFLKFCDFLHENIQELIGHKYASHVVRAMLEALSGVRISEKIVRSRSSIEGKPKNAVVKKTLQNDPNTFAASAISTTVAVAIPESFFPVLKKVTKTIIKRTNLESIVTDPVSNPVLATLLLVLNSRDKSFCSRLCKAVIATAEKDKEGNKNLRIPSLFTHEIGSHLVEIILHVASPTLHQEMFEKYFKTDLLQLSQHPIANYIVQHLLATTADQEQAEIMVVELLEYVEDILAMGHMGVITRIAETCARFKMKQKAFVGSLLESFHCNGKEERKQAVPLVLSLTTYEVYYGVPDRHEQDDESRNKEVEKPQPRQLDSINYHGAIILKTLFGFEKPKIFVKSLLLLSPEELLTIACDITGSHTIDGFLQSLTVAPKKKHEFADKMKGQFIKLATDKHGSRVIDNCWRHLESKDREAIKQELVKHEEHLSKNFFGRIVLRNCGIHSKRKAGHLNKEEKALKKQKMLDQILGAEREVPQTKQKSKKLKKASKEKKKKSTTSVKEERNAVSHAYDSELKILAFDPDAETEDDFNLQSPSRFFKNDENETDQCQDDTIDLLFSKRKAPEVDKKQTGSKGETFLNTEEKKVSSVKDLSIPGFEATKRKKKRKMKNKK